MTQSISALAASVHHALLQGLDDYVDTFRGQTTTRRPYEDNCKVTMFQQGWGSTALGFGGIGGQACTNAYTVVVEGPMGDACVYFAGRLAYHVKRPNDLFRLDLHGQNMGDVMRWPRYEGKVPKAPAA